MEIFKFPSLSKIDHILILMLLFFPFYIYISANHFSGTLLEPKEHIFDLLYITINSKPTYDDEERDKTWIQSKYVQNAFLFKPVMQAAWEMKGNGRTCVRSAMLARIQVPASASLLEGVRANMSEAAVRLIKKKGIQKKKIKPSGLSLVNLGGLEAAGGPSVQDHGWRWLL